MKEMVQRRCDLLVENWKLIHKDFKLENGIISMVAASSFMEKDQTADAEFMKECRKILRKKQGVFSEFRGNNELIVTSKMALSGNPEGYIDDVIEVYKKLQNGKFWDSTYRALAAMVICDSGRYNETDALIEKTNAIMKGMKAAHPFLTSDEDTCFAVLLAMTDKNVDDILSELEETYQYLKKNFTLHDNAVYSLSQVLTTYEGNYEQKREKALGIFEAFKAAGNKYGKDYELASLGTLIEIQGNIEEVVAEIAEISEYLKGQKGFGMLDMGKQTRLMFATMIYTQEYASDNQKTGASVVSGAVARVVAEQIAMFVAIIAATSSSSAAASSSH